MEENIKRTTTRGRKPKAKTQESKIDNINADTNKSYKDLEQENQNLKSEMDTIKEMLAKLMKQKNTEAIVSEKHIVKEKKYSEDCDEVNPNKRIPIVSLYNGILALTTEKRGGVEYVFSEFGDVQLIRYSHLSEILHNYGHFAKKGYFYIENEAVVVNHGLIEYYEKLLDKDTIYGLFDIDKKEMIKLYERTTDEQRQEIISWLLEKVSNGEALDLNKLNILKKIYDKKNHEDLDDDFYDEY